MSPRFVVCVVVAVHLSAPVWAQAPTAGKFRPPVEAGSKTSARAVEGTPTSPPATEPGQAAAAKATAGPGVLPSDHGQFWREYDLAPYTSKIKTTERPEQAVVDWILRETGTEVWFSQPLGLLCADAKTLRVYHTAPMQQVVASVVDRFVASEGKAQPLSLRLLSVGNPSWRSKTHTLLRPVAVQTPGVEAWITSRENAAVVLGELKKRPDFREHNASSMAVPAGQSQTVAHMKPRPYTRAAQARDPSRPGTEVELAQIDEGFSLQISPLPSADGRTMDAVIKCQVDQVEKLVPVFLEPANPRLTAQKMQIQIPQVVGWRLHERYRWPVEEVIVMSCGVVASPAIEKSSALSALAGSGRAEAILMIECLGQPDPSPAEPAKSAGAAPGNRGRY